MIKKSFSFSSSTVNYYFNADFNYLEQLVSKDNAVIVTDENVFAKHQKKFKGWKSIIIKAGEQHKVQATVDDIIQQLIDVGADRNTTLVGVGGGVITDITGYVAGIYMRGIAFGFVPTSILAMVDAAIGGKNGIDVGLYKNMVGLIKQPAFLLYDFSLLKSLPKEEWVNGFAEVIKHACIKDAPMFNMLEENKLDYFQKDPENLAKLIQRNALLKTKVVVTDEFENGDRKLLNFGHTIGHAVENLYKIPHGHAVSIGMGVACKFSEEITGFKDTARVVNVLKQYGLPPQFEFDKEETFRILKSDKKKSNQSINYVLLNKIGKATIVPLPFEQIHALINNL
ncbi:3-dehydroquinate synthase [Segetibacter aerophilus]|uniref:3-dehydroquinate synthase n=1 Tax=Segetibacter aerophilus TaxID=670293 RepID=A0A512BG83_9BACT|nr:3-dehydroquinate synthase [Segetibacter aerophilus]GEO10847.1 3-dehydroquinate synthase [Segetibacter aerophilus]